MSQNTKYFIGIVVSYLKRMKSRNISFLLLSIILLSSTISNAAALSFNLDSQINLSNNSGDSQTPQIKTSGSDVYVVWKDNTSGTNNILFKKSTDDGATFGSLVTLDSGVANSQDPQVSVSGTNVYSVWQDGTGPKIIAFARSSNSGGSFGAQVTLSSSTATSVLPQIASSASDVYVTWQQGTEIYFSDSGDSGGTFDAPVSLSGASSAEPKLALSGNNVYVTWEEGIDISFIKSADNGENFDIKINLSNSAATSRDPDIVASGNNVYVTWKEGTDIYFAKSTDSGATFSAPIDIGDTGGNTTPNPKIAYDGTIYVVWSETVSGKGDISFRSSVDGVTFTAKQNISSNTGSSTIPQIVSDAGNVVVAWQDDTPGNNDVFVKSSDDSGVTFGSVQNISGNAGFSLAPKVSLVGTRSFFVWEDTTPDGAGFDRDILFRTGVPSLISVSFDDTQYTLNESAQITVNDLLSSDSIDVTVISTSDPTGLLVTLTETGVGTGEFQGTVDFDDVTTASAIKAKAGDTITASFGGQSSDATIFPITITVELGASAFTSFDYGDIVNIKVDDKNSNEDPALKDTITVSVKSTRDVTGITLTLEETDINTGIFGDTASTLIFTDGNTNIPTTGTMTVSHTDSSANTDISAIDISQVTVTSTSDSVGITLDLAETGINTGQFQKTLSLSTASVPDSTIEVAAGDILSVTSGFFTSNALVTPNSDPAKGAISVDFANDDTVTVSYLAESHSVTAKDSAGPGGGGGGLVRPGLVVNALAGIGIGGGGSSASAPLIYLTDLVSSSAIDVPPEIEQMVLAHNSAVPIPPMELDSFGDFDFPLVLNGKGFVLGGFTNTLETQTLKTNTPAIMKFTVYESEKIQHFSLYTNLIGKNTAIPQSDTKILYNDGKELQVIDPQGFFADAKITVTEIDSIKKQVLVEITFAKPMETSDVIIRSWDPRLHSRDMYILDAIKVESDNPKPNPLQQNPAPELDELKSTSIPIWVKNNAGWWSEQQIDDQDFVAGIQYMINHGIITIQNTEIVSASETKIPYWIKNNAGWWATHQISDDDFVKAMEWLVSNGVVTLE